MRMMRFSPPLAGRRPPSRAVMTASQSIHAIGVPSLARSSGWGRGAGLAGGDGAGQDPERSPQRAFGDHREDGGVLPALLGRRPVVVGRHERALLEWL